MPGTGGADVSEPRRRRPCDRWRTCGASLEVMALRREIPGVGAGLRASSAMAGGMFGLFGRRWENVMLTITMTMTMGGSCFCGGSLDEWDGSLVRCWGSLDSGGNLGLSLVAKYPFTGTVQYSH